MYISRIENRISFKIKTGVSSESFLPDTTKLLGTPEEKINRYENGKIVSQLEITEIILDYCNNVNNY